MKIDKKEWELMSMRNLLVEEVNQWEIKLKDNRIKHNLMIFLNCPKS